MSAAIEQRNQDATCYLGNLDEKVTEGLLWELMVQFGPVVNVHMPKDKVTGKYIGYGFVEYKNEDDAEYATKVVNMVKLYGKPLKVNKAAADKRIVDIGANIFLGNLDPEVDEKLLYDTFSAFGGITKTPTVLTDPETGVSKGFGFISFDTFEASDLAIECMNGQFLSNRAIVVQYAFRKDTPGERHGSQAERILAASNPQKFKPNTHFSAQLGEVTSATAPAPNPQQYLYDQLPVDAHQQHQMQQHMGQMGYLNPNPMMMMQQHQQHHFGGGYGGGYDQMSQMQYMQHQSAPPYQQQYGAYINMSHGGAPPPPPLPSGMNGSNSSSMMMGTASALPPPPPAVPVPPPLPSSAGGAPLPAAPPPSVELPPPPPPPPSL